ncbi:MAG: InlB B-repeat-containing protein [Eubacterium sp.]|nr:InlB B-repeat-containing protein [Eubacterium sp.]
MNRIKKRISLILMLAMLLSLITPQTMSNAAAGPKLSSKKANIIIGQKKTVKVKCRVAGNISVRSLNPYFCDVVKVKKTLKKKKPASFTLKALCAGYSIIAVHVKLKKKIKGQREFDLQFHAYTVDKPSPSPSPTATSTATPGNTPTVSPTVSPTGSPTVSMKPSSTPSASPTATARASATPTSSATPRPTSTPAPTPDPYNYTVTYTHNLSSDKVVTGMPDPLVVKVPKDGDCKLTLPPAPHCDGYYLDSWIYKNDYRKSPGDVVTIDKDMTIKARFVRDTNICIIQYETGAQQHPEIRGVINGTTVAYGGTLTISSITPSWTGHTFSGWQMSGYDTIYQPGDTISNIHSDFTLYAVWDTDVSSLPAATTPPKEAEVLSKILEKKADYPEGSEYSADKTYRWTYGNIYLTCKGPGAFVAVLSDAGFGVGSNVISVSFGIDRHNFRIGDVINWDNLDKKGIIVGLDYEYFTLAEANDGVVHWNTKLPRSTSIGHVDCRW